MAPAQSIGNGVGGGIGEHWEHVGLGIPEGVPVVAWTGQALGRNGPPFSPGSRLEDVEEREAHRLLDLGIAVDLDVSAIPEVVQIGVLLLGQGVPAHPTRAGERRGDLISQRRPRTIRGPAVGDELDDAQPLARLEGGGDRHPAQIREALGRHLRRRRTLDPVVHGHRDPLATPHRGVQEGGTGITAFVGLRAQQRFEHGWQPRVPAGRRNDLVRHELGLDHHPQRPADWFDLVSDRGHRALDQRHQARRAHPDRAPPRRHPLDISFQEARAEVERSLMGPELAGTDIEGLVVEEQADELGVGDVDHRLTGLGVAVAVLGVGQRTGLVHTVEVRAGEAVGLAFVEVAPPADVTVGQGEQRFTLGQHVEVELGLPQAPGFDEVGRMLDQGRPKSSARSVTTVSAPWARWAWACPTRSTPTTKPPARPASTPDRASSKTAAWSGSAPSARAAAR